MQAPEAAEGPRSLENLGACRVHSTQHRNLQIAPRFWAAGGGWQLENNDVGRRREPVAAAAGISTDLPKPSAPTR